MKNNQWTNEAKVELVLTILAGETTVEQAAVEHGLDRTEIESWRMLYVGGLQHAVRSARPGVLGWLRCTVRRHPLFASAAALLVVGLLLLAPLTALSETPEDCDDPDSLDLCEFKAGEPAVASEVNSNFRKIVAWLEQKVGARGESDITANDNLTVAGNASIDGDLTLQGNGTLSNDLQVEGSSTVAELKASGPVEMFGNLNQLSVDETYTAPTDGLVFAFAYFNGYEHHLRIQGMAGSVEPLQLLTQTSVRSEAGDTGTSIVFPVKKGNLWRVEDAGSHVAPTVAFLPLGGDQRIDP